MSQPFIVRRAFAAALCAGLLAWSGAAPSQSPEAGAARGSVVGVAHIGRMVSNLDASLRFYKAIGFTQDASIDSSWRDDASLNRLYGIKGARSRVARMVLNSSVSGQPFVLYLRELKGIQRRNLAGYVTLQVEGLDALLARAQAANARVVSTRGIVTLKDGSRAVLIRDPDVGGFIELFERPRTEYIRES